MTITEIEYGSLASSKKLNDNFNALNKDIQDLATSLSTTNANVATNISTLNKNITNQISEVNEDLASTKKELTEKNTTLEASLNSVDERINNINVMPDLSKRINISSGYTAPSQGWVYAYTAQGGLYYNALIAINKVEVGICFNTYGDRTGGGSAFVPVSKDDVITFGRVSSAFFAPCKGV